ncbi:MAG TPA: glycosyltransferase [Chloroflexota bacterium]|nr:glycosyltransferase [Chloroflexota bacterium]
MAAVKVAIVCSWLNQYGGAERVLEVLHGIFPEAPIYTSVYDATALPPSYRSWDIRPSFLQRLPGMPGGGPRRLGFYLPLLPTAFEQLDLTEYDLVIDNSSAFSYGVITRPDACHISYCLTPARFLWAYQDYVRREGFGRFARLVLPPFLTYLRVWDRLAADRVDHFIAISNAVAARVQKFYHRPAAAVIYPPIDVRNFHLSDEVDDYYFIVSRLIPYKRIDLAVQAFTRLGLPLKIAGSGRDRSRLETMAGPNIQFLGRVSDDELVRLYSRCRAFIFPGEEDFGLTPLEAHASGRPVIAFGAGGAKETIVPGLTGTFFYEPSADALADAVESLDTRDVDPATIRHHAERFDVTHFKEQLLDFIEDTAGVPIGRSRLEVPPGLV